MSADYGPAIWLPSPGRYWQGRNGDKPRYIILHGTAGGTSAQAIGNWLNTQTEREPTSVHYVIGVDGTVVQLVSEADSAWGNGVLSAGHDSWWTPNPNWYTVSIEHCKPNVDNSNTLSPAQQDASFALVRHLCEKWGIPKRAADAGGGVTGHKSIDPVERAFCPGAYPWDTLFAYLGGGTMAGVPHGWHDDGATLTAPNGVALHQGVRAQVLAGWDAANVPLAAEHYCNPCDPTDPHSGDGSRTLFRDSMLVWVKASNSFHRAPLGVYVQQLEARQPNPAEHQKLVSIKTIVADVA